MKTVTMGSGSGFWGDLLEPAVEMAQRSDIQYLGFDHLSELTMAILSRRRVKNADDGFVPDVIPWMRAILPAARRRGIRMLTNAGGANPRACAEAVSQVAEELGYSGLRIGIVGGDDVLAALPGLEDQGWTFRNMDTGEEGLERIRGRLVAANAYIGAEGIVEQLRADADLVITGRVSDNALYVGPLLPEFGWNYAEHSQEIAAAVTVGHVIECAACVTGGMSTMWRLSDQGREVGFPVAEFRENCEAVISKTPDSGGVVNEWTVKEHLLYEIQDPANYVMPDGVADFTGVQLFDDGPGRVGLRGMGGGPRPEHAKACLAYTNGWIGEGMAFFPWPDALEKAQFAARWLEQRMERLGLRFEDRRVDLVGVNMLQGEAAPVADYDAAEVGLRFAVRAQDRESAEVIRREITHLWTMGRVGSSIGPPSRVRPVVSLWPTLIPWEAVSCFSEQLEVR